MSTLRITDVGDTAFNVEFGESVDPAINARVTSLRQAILQAQQGGNLPGIIETIPTFRSLLIHYSPLLASRAELEEAVVDLAAGLGESAAGSRRLWSIPVCYDADLGEDLDDLCAARGLDRDQAIALHSSAEFFVYMLGFMPGFAYMGGVPDPLRLPRRSSPRLKVPPGSVAVADSLCAVYPWESPGGWHLIGRTPVRFFDLEREPSILLAAGDRVRFHAIGRADFQAALDDSSLVAPSCLLIQENRHG